MNIYNLRYFVTLARIRQYTKAAEDLCITQPSLSHAISQMEKELGVKLVEKNGHKITLTQFGEEFLSYAEKTLDVLDDGIASIKRSAMGNGTIRLGLVRPLGISYVPRMAAAFIKKNPQLDIDFTFHTDVTGRLLDDMQLGMVRLQPCRQVSVGQQVYLSHPRGVLLDAPEPIAEQPPLPVAGGVIVGAFRGPVFGVIRLPDRVRPVHPWDHDVNGMRAHWSCAPSFFCSSAAQSRQKPTE